MIPVKLPHSTPLQRRGSPNIITLIFFSAKNAVLIFTLLSTAFISSCKKECSCEQQFGDYLLFGNYYGMCAGEDCVEIFKIENGVLSEDSNDNYPSDSPYSGNYAVLPSAKYDLVKDLSNYIPAQLFNENDGYIGTPDAYDQGGYVLELKENGTHRYWRIDTDTSNTPDYLHAFTDTLRNYIDKISD